MAKKKPTKPPAAEPPRAKKLPAGAKKPAAKKPTPQKSASQQAPPKKTPDKKTSAKKTPATKRPTSKRKETPMNLTKKKPATKRTAKLATVKMPPPDKSVEGYLATLNDWRRDAVASLRTMIQKAAPKASENVKWSQPVYEHHGPFAWIKAHAKHVNLGFWRGVELPDPRKLLRGTGNKMRHIKLGSLKDAGKKELQELVRIAAKLNEIKGNPTRPAKGKAKHK
jgi:hypothetical protein